MKNREQIRQTIGIIIVAVGMFVAVCTTDGSKHEILLRLSGVAAMAAGVIIGRLWKYEKPKTETPCQEEN